MTFINALSLKNRSRKFDIFLDEIDPLPNETILDIGVTVTNYAPGDNYLEKHYAYPKNITAISEENMEGFSKQYPEVRSIQADGRKLPFDDNCFDISYSNAVIEHVGTHEKQLSFLKESFRVAKRGYLTTPNKYFPVEIHTRVPLLHIFLPKRYFDAFLICIGKKWASGDYMHLLSYAELNRLLKESGIRNFQIRKNRFFGIVMTFTVTWKK